MVLLLVPSFTFILGSAPSINERACICAVDSPTAWNMPLTFERVRDLEDDHFHHGRKLSVISKVKEKARKWRQRLVQKKHVDDDNDTPSWGVAMEDYEEEDLEHLGVSSNVAQASLSLRLFFTNRL